MKQPKYQIISGMAGFLTIIALSNLIYKVHTTQNAESITYTWIFLIISAQMLFILYGLLNKSYGIYLPSSFALIGVSYILFVKYKSLKEVENSIEKELINKNIL